MKAELSMLERFYKAYEDADFNLFEITGFKDKPELAFVAGAAVGYRLAIEDAQGAIKEGSKDEI